VEADVNGLKLRVTAVVATLALWAAAGAEAATVNSATVYRDEPGGVPQRILHSGNANFTFYGEANWVYISATVPGDSGPTVRLEFSAPYGYALTPGVYDRAQRSSFRDSGRPGMDVNGGASGCNKVDGRFEVKDSAFTAEGKPERLWIVYEQRCEGSFVSQFGEVRIGMPVPDGATTVHPSVVRWPATDLGRPGFPVPVEVAANAATQVTGVSVVGAHPSDFTLPSDACSGQSLTAGGSCRVVAQFTPTTPGTREATLRITDSSGGVREVALQGFSWGGTTRLVIQSDPDEPVAQGKGGSYTYANANEIIATGDRYRLSYGVAGKDGQSWGGAFAPASGDVLTVGHFGGATAYPGTSSTPGIQLGFGHIVCGSRAEGEFTIRELRFHQDGLLRSAALDFVQYCGGPGAMRGTFEFRKGDQTTPPPWMTWRSAGTPLPPAPAETTPPAPCRRPRRRPSLRPRRRLRRPGGGYAPGGRSPRRPPGGGATAPTGSAVGASAS
jgi:hypothetical protein